MIKAAQSQSLTNEQEKLCINTLRMLSVDMVEKAASGHPGLPLGAAPLVYTLWTRYLVHNPKDPKWPERDRFILSAGHGSALLYSLLHLTGYDLSLEELKNFRQLGSKTPGHPEAGLTPGVEAVTGPLGQGIANGVGMALAERWAASHFNRPDHEIVNHFTYVFSSDGDMMEGISSEAASLAGHLQLGKLIVFYLDNKISIEGKTSVSFSEDVAARFMAFGWDIQRTEGNDMDQIEEAIFRARQNTSQPTLIVARTHIGFGSPHKQDTEKAHGEPLGPEELAATKKYLDWPLDPSFHIPQESLTFFRQAIDAGKEYQSLWEERMRDYKKAFPQLAEEWELCQTGGLPEDWNSEIPVFDPKKKSHLSTRKASGQVINALSDKIPWFIGGSADLAPSNSTRIEKGGDVLPGKFDGKNLHFGVREHAMGAIVNGMLLHGGLRVFGATFFIFSDYLRPTLRLAALSKIPSIFVFTHDSIGLGEDGPTHQPVEHLLSLRAIPNLITIRPADANETAEAWKFAIQHRSGPVALVLTRQDLPVLDLREGELAKGAYILTDAASGKPDAILVATGSEVSLALEAQKKLDSEGIKTRVVSMPSWELFDRQSPEYRKKVFPPDVPARLAIEAGSPLGWSDYVGSRDNVIGVNRFGASGPGKKVFEAYGFTAANIVQRVKDLLKKGVKS